MKTFAFAALFTVLMTGCATVQQGPMQRIHVSSEPSGATVTTKDCGTPGGPKVTPAVLFVSRHAGDCVVRVSLPDYFPARVPLHREVSSAAHSNLMMLTAPCGETLDGCGSAGEAFFLTLLGAAAAGVGYTVDFATGGAFELHPSEIHVQLRHRFDPTDEELELDGHDEAVAEPPPAAR